MQHPYLTLARKALDENFHSAACRGDDEKKNLYDALSRMAATMESMDNRMREMQATIAELKARS